VERLKIDLEKRVIRFGLIFLKFAHGMIGEAALRKASMTPTWRLHLFLFIR